MSKNKKFKIEPALAMPMLRKKLSDTDDAAFLCMIWAVHAVQDSRATHAARFLDYPKEAETTEINSKYAAHKWDLESLITLNFNTPKTMDPVWRQRPIDTRSFNSVADIVNLLRAAQDHESDDHVDHTNILLELHRIAHRTFAWQRGLVRAEDIYRYLYIYGQGECAAYFEKTNGLSVMDFFTVAFGHFGYLTRGPWMERIRDMDVLKVSQHAIDRSIQLLSGDIWDVRRESKALLSKFEKSLGTKLPVIYQPSYLRLKPIIRRAVGLRDRYIAPLPALIVMRATMGLYYDIQNGGVAVTNDATKRFEEYARRSIKAHCPGFDPAPAMTYVHKKNPVETPDILLKQDRRIAAVFECKATKLTFEAQYGNDPVENAKTGYSQIAKAIFQLWRFFSHIRRGIIELDVAPNAPAIVLTLDSWTQMSHELRNALIAEAEKIATVKEPEMIEEDKRRPVFCPIHELDQMLTLSNEEQLLAAFRAASDVYYQGWNIRQVRSDAVPKLERKRGFAFDAGEFLPWWRELVEARAATGQE
ncbi:hypothetical protein N0Q91_09180 [Sinorhizobium sp. K101]|uniref:hypothetical protein n=1 Tax=unclassified Sinorhizobium TaxID=2613772 RepID=UPI0023D85AD1|nr:MULTISPECIES: hypothetical protein [unclassified Sinorhizobium]WEJ11574.1 hypothetical protein N0Q90_11140 [Sinorhizobium sp. M103]WEJ16712.1 hypothetical protein N0Q91_09180 [Sinorhizobium sp. K101]